MGTVYPLNNGKNLILYESQNALYLRILSDEQITEPVLLCSDFSAGLSDTLYRDNVYFCYQNAGQDIIIRSITDFQELYRIKSQETRPCFHPVLINFQNTLLLFFAAKNPINGAYSLKALSPFDSRTDILLPEKSFSACPAITCIVSGNDLLVCAQDPLSRLVLSFDADRNCSVLTGLESLLREKEAVIEQVKRQYEELMETAFKYKEEAAKWHALVQKQNTRPLPGEYLIQDNW